MRRIASRIVRRHSFFGSTRPRDFYRNFARFVASAGRPVSIRMVKEQVGHRWWGRQRTPRPECDTHPALASSPMATTSGCSPGDRLRRYATGPAVRGRSSPNRSLTAPCGLGSPRGTVEILRRVKPPLRRQDHRAHFTRQYARPFIGRGASKRPRMVSPAVVFLRLQRVSRGRQLRLRRDPSSFDA